MINKYVNELQKNGFIIIDNIFNKKQTTLAKKKLDIILKNRIKKNMIVGDEDNQIMYNYFFEDKSLLKLIYIPLVDKILKKVLDDHYVLCLGNAQNRILNFYNIKKKKKNYKIGSTWHTDSRYLGKKRISRGFSYFCIIALDPFTKQNGATKFIPKSVKFSSIPSRKITDNSKKYKVKNLIMKEGSICIMDSGIWHKAGKSSNLSRWSIFNLYTGWFVKPYFDYKKLTKQNIKKIYKKLLHGFADPPKINGNRINTVVKY